MKKSGIKESNSRTCPRCKGRGFIGKSQYHRGRSFEYKVRDYLKARGWTVYRSFASKGVIDLLATKHEIKIGIQVKNRKTGVYLSPKEIEEITGFYHLFEGPSNESYSMNIWKNHKISSITTKAPIKTILAFSLPDVREIQWRRWVGSEWVDAQKLIKTGKL